MKNFIKTLLVSAVIFPVFACSNASARNVKFVKSGLVVDVFFSGGRKKGEFEKKSGLEGKYVRLKKFLQENEAIQRKIDTDIRKIEDAQLAVTASTLQATQLRKQDEEDTNVNPKYYIENDGGDVVKTDTTVPVRYESIGVFDRVVTYAPELAITEEGFTKGDSGAATPRKIQVDVSTKNEGDTALGGTKVFYARRMVADKYVVIKNRDNDANINHITKINVADTDNVGANKYTENEASKKYNEGNFVKAFSGDDDTQEVHNILKQNAGQAHDTALEQVNEVLANENKRKSLAFILDKETFLKHDLKTLSSLLFLNLKGHGIVSAKATDTTMTSGYNETKTFIADISGFEGYDGVTSDIRKAFNEALESGEFTKNLQEYGAANNLKVDSENADLKLAAAKKISWSGGAALGYRAVYGDFVFHGGLIGEVTLAGKTLEMKDATNTDSSNYSNTQKTDETTNDSSNKLTTGNYTIGVTEKWSIGPTFGIGYAVSSVFYVGFGADIIMTKYNIDTNDIDNLFLAYSGDVVENRLSELGIKTEDFNKEVLDAGLGKGKLSTSKWNINPYFRLDWFFSDCASLFFKGSYSNRNVLSDSNLFGKLKLSGIKFTMGFSFIV